MKRSTSCLWILTLGALASEPSCSDTPPVGTGGSGGSLGAGGGGGGILGPDGSSRTFIDLDAAMVSRDAGTGEAGVCKTQQVTAKMETTRLAFAFDVSGSMGEEDYPWHDKSLKWDPVVAATKGFFSNPKSQGIEASLVFFPTGDDDVKCSANTYATPQVPMTALPSPAFANAIDAQYPDGGGTPTVAVVKGTLTYIRAQRTVRPGKYVLVLATDGYPASCGSDNNNIALAASAVAAGLADGISTYVIGVRNPPIPDAPDVTSNLSQIAAAGGTTVFFLDTGTPSTTEKAFAAAIDQIRGAAIACDILIPEPPAGLTFDKEKVILTYTSGTNAPSVLTYDPACAGPHSWHYDSAASPTRVVLCPSSCTTIQADPNAVLNVGFACEQVISVIP